MTSIPLSHGLVMGAVVAIQSILLWKTRRLVRQDDRASLAALELQFADDIRTRAKRGHAPEWLRYQAEVDRLFEFRDDRLRSLAAAALAVGLGGTLFALFISILLGRSAPLEPMNLVHSMGISLLGSLIGVGVNLWIVLFDLPKAERAFFTQAKSLFGVLEQVSEEHSPQEAFTQTLREELSRIRESLNTEFASAFSTAITGFPQVVTELGFHIKKLAAVVEGQGQSIGGAVGDLTKCAIAVASSSNRLQPAAEKLAQATEVLIRMPQALAEVVDETRNRWLTGIREQHEEHLKQLVDLQQQIEGAAQERERQVLNATQELQAAVAEVRAAVDRIPGHLAAEVAKASSRLGIEFGREARDHTNELAAHLEGEYKKLLEHIERNEQHSLNKIGTVVQELFDRISGTVEEHLVAHLLKVARELEEVVHLLPEAATKLTEAHAELSRSQGESLDNWREVSRSTGDAAQKLVNADGQLHVAVEALGASAEHFKRVALLTDGLEDSILTSHREAIEKYMNGLDSLREQLLEILQKLEDRQAQINVVVDGQSEVIRACIQQLMKGRQAATFQETA